MDKKTLEEIEVRLLEVNEIVKKLDESIRVAAFEFLRPYIAGKPITASPPSKDHKDEHIGGDAGGVTDLATLVEKFGSTEKPSDNARLLSAWWFSQYGTAPFTHSWIEDTAATTGLTVPASLGMTFKQLKTDGKLLYNPLGKGEVEPTVAGESFFQKTYGVKKGTKTPPVADDKSK